MKPIPTPPEVLELLDEAALGGWRFAEAGGGEYEALGHYGMALVCGDSAGEIAAAIKRINARFGRR